MNLKILTFNKFCNCTNNNSYLLITIIMPSTEVYKNEQEIDPAFRNIMMFGLELL